MCDCSAPIAPIDREPGPVRQVERCRRLRGGDDLIRAIPKGEAFQRARVGIEDPIVGHAEQCVTLCLELTIVSNVDGEMTSTTSSGGASIPVR